MEPNQMQEKKSNGALVGSVIVIILIIIAGVYLWTNQIKNTEETNLTTEQNTNTEQTINGEDVSSAVINSLNEIEKELEGVDTNITIESTLE